MNAAALRAPVDAASLAAFRVLFGGVMCAAMVRALTSGWIDEVLVQPSFFFKYPGLTWLPVGPPWVLKLHVAVLAMAAACVSLGLFYRIAAPLFCLGFLALEALDATNYLNHYYLVVLLSGILSCVPAHRMWSLDALRRPALRSEQVPAWALWLVRFQLGTVYFFAGLAKLQPDWLLHGQPLGIWLRARADLPLLGGLLALPETALFMSWAGFLYDLTITGFLLWRRTRPLAYATVVFFHTMTWALFDIGMFPLIMMTSTLVFFSPSWPRRLIKARTVAGPAPKTARLTLPLLAVYCAFQVLFPLRHFLYEGDVLWNDRGMRYAWKVLVREKHGSVTYRVKAKGAARERLINPARYLQPRQVSEMSARPALIHQLAFHVAADLRARGWVDPEVRVDAVVSLNGRAPRPLIDPTVDLLRVDPHAGDWILPAPTTPPLSLE